METAKTVERANYRHWFFEGMARLRKNRGAMLAGFVVLIYLLLALVGHMIVPYDPLDIDFLSRFSGPSKKHWFGADELGRDIFSRVIVGTRLSFGMAGIAVAIGLVGGIFLGMAAGYFRKLDDPIMRVMDIVMSFPSFLLAIAIVAALGPGMFNGILAIGISSIPEFVRITRASVLSLREQEFIDAARSIGATDTFILFKHVLPNLLGPLIVFGTLRLSNSLLAAAGLSFLGLGAQPPAPEWGAMASTGRLHIALYPHLVFFPSLAIFGLVLALNFLGDGVRDAFDPRLK